MNTFLARKNLDQRFRALRANPALQRPPRGWIRAIRDALGLTTAQLAKHVQVSQSTIVAFEHSERKGSISLATLERVATAMNCSLVYALVPNVSLETIVNEQAQHYVDAQLARVHHSMALEAQHLDPKHLQEERDALVEETLRTRLRRIWDTNS